MSTSMEINEIKKALYKQKPIASKCETYESGIGGAMVNPFQTYRAVIDVDQGRLAILTFKVPFIDMGNNHFKDEEPAQLLIRWLYTERIV